jgi:hypothetical protein
LGLKIFGRDFNASSLIATYSIVKNQNPDIAHTPFIHLMDLHYRKQFWPIYLLVILDLIILVIPGIWLLYGTYIYHNTQEEQLATGLAFTCGGMVWVTIFMMFLNISVAILFSRKHLKK